MVDKMNEREKKFLKIVNDRTKQKDLEAILKSLDLLERYKEIKNERPLL